MQRCRMREVNESHHQPEKWTSSILSQSVPDWSKTELAGIQLQHKEWTKPRGLYRNSSYTALTGPGTDSTQVKSIGSSNYFTFDGQGNRNCESTSSGCTGTTQQ